MRDLILAPTIQDTREPNEVNMIRFSVYTWLSAIGFLVAISSPCHAQFVQRPGELDLDNALIVGPGSGEFATIQNAYDALSDTRRVILVKPGTYVLTEPLNLNAAATLQLLGDTPPVTSTYFDLTHQGTPDRPYAIMGYDPLNPPVLDFGINSAEEAHSAAIVIYGRNWYFSDLTIKNTGYAFWSEYGRFSIENTSIENTWRDAVFVRGDTPGTNPLKLNNEGFIRVRNSEFRTINNWLQNGQPYVGGSHALYVEGSQRQIPYIDFSRNLVIGATGYALHAKALTALTNWTNGEGLYYVTVEDNLIINSRGSFSLFGAVFEANVHHNTSVRTIDARLVLESLGNLPKVDGEFVSIRESGLHDPHNQIINNNFVSYGAEGIPLVCYENPGRPQCEYNDLSGNLWRLHLQAQFAWNREGGGIATNQNFFWDYPFLNQETACILAPPGDRCDLSGDLTSNHPIHDFLTTSTANQGVRAGVTVGRDVVHNDPPEAIVEASPTSGSAPLTVSFDASASNDPDGAISSYNWIFGDGHIGSGLSTSHVYTVGGIYTARLTVIDNDGATASVSTTIDVNEVPVAQFSASPSGGIIPLTVTFDASSSYDPDGTITEYHWTFDDGATGDGALVNHTFTSPGTFIVTLQVKDDNNATAAISSPVSVEGPNKPPAVRFLQPVDGSVFAAGSEIQLKAYASDPDGTVADVEFRANDDLIAPPIVTEPYIYNWSTVSEGDYTLKALARDNDGASTLAQIYIIVESFPTCGSNNYLIQNQLFNDTQSYIARSSISTNEQVILEESADILFRAGDTIILTPGFRAVHGSRLLVMARGCNDSTSNLAQLSGSTVDLLGPIDAEPQQKSHLQTGSGSEPRPLTFSLDPNYPNPFNSTTTIRYALPEDTMVRIDILNILGQRVKTLLHSSQRAGFKSVAWDATNEAGQVVPSGTYIYRMMAGTFIRSGRMVLLR